MLSEHELNEIKRDYLILLGKKHGPLFNMMPNMANLIFLGQLARLIYHKPKSLLFQGQKAVEHFRLAVVVAK